MLKNPFEPNLKSLNDPEDFKIPYLFYGGVDRENMLYRYLKLKKSSHGYIIRLGQNLYG